MNLSRVRFEYFRQPVSAVAVYCTEDVCTLQRDNALVRPCQSVCIPYRCRVGPPVVDTEGQLSVFRRGIHHRACPFQRCGLDHAFFELPVNLLTLVFSCLQPGPVWMLEGWTEVWLPIGMMPHGSILPELSSQMLPNSNRRLLFFYQKDCSWQPPSTCCLHCSGFASDCGELSSSGPPRTLAVPPSL